MITKPTVDECTALRAHAEARILVALNELTDRTGLDLIRVEVFLIVRADEVEDGSCRLPRRRAAAVRIDLGV